MGRMWGHWGVCGGRVGSGLGPSEPWLFETASLTLFGVPAERDSTGGREAKIHFVFEMWDYSRYN